MKRLLWIGDSPDCQSGFGRATAYIVDALRFVCDVSVLGVNSRGDHFPNGRPYPIYAAMSDGDAFGVLRTPWVCFQVQPDVIVIQSDGWNLQSYISQIRRTPECRETPIVAVVAVDGKNFQSAWLNGLSHVIFWTQFALREARKAGYFGPASVIPLGVDRSIYKPIDKREAREQWLPSLKDAFIVGNVNRNQWRKRLDLTIKYFAEWVKEKYIGDAYLYLHFAPTGDASVDAKQLMEYYGVLDKLALMEPKPFCGIEEEKLALTYNCFDVQVSTTQGEGFGLTTLEGMACGVPQIVPGWSGLIELCEGASRVVSCSSTAVGFPFVNVIGGVADQALFTDALDEMYRQHERRREWGQLALARASDDRYDWQRVGDAYVNALAGLLSEMRVTATV